MEQIQREVLHKVNKTPLHLFHKRGWSGDRDRKFIIHELHLVLVKLFRPQIQTTHACERAKLVKLFHLQMQSIVRHACERAKTMWNQSKGPCRPGMRRSKGQTAQQWHGISRPCSTSSVLEAAHGQIKPPAHPGNSVRPRQCAGTEHPALALKKEDLGLRLLFNVIVHRSVQSMI